MESRILYLEKEVNILRKKFNLLENTLQNDIKNYIDEYMQSYVEQLEVDFQKISVKTYNKNKTVKCEPKKAKVKLEYASNISSGTWTSKQQTQTNGKIVPQYADANDQDDDKSDNQEFLNDDENCEAGTANSFESDPFTEYREEGEDVWELNDLENTEENIVEANYPDIEMTQNNEFEESIEYSDGEEVIENEHAKTSTPTIRIGSTFVRNSSFCLPTILSVAREKASRHAETAIALPVSSNIKQSPGQICSNEKDRWPFQCPICLDRFKCNSHFDKHKIKHVPDRPFKCQYCGKTYKRIHHLKEHQILTHRGEINQILPNGRRFRCLVCSKVFTRLSLLSTHAKTHSKEGTVVRYGIVVPEQSLSPETSISNTPESQGSISISNTREFQGSINNTPQLQGSISNTPQLQGRITNTPQFQGFNLTL